MSPTVRTHITVISLSDASTRRAAFRSAVPDDAPPWGFFDACRGLTAGLAYDPSVAARTHGRSLSPGELGCYGSHYAVWRSLVDDTSYDQLVVLEDDVLVDWAALGGIAQCDFAARGHHYVRLFGRKPSPFRVLVSDYLPGPRALIAFAGKPFGTQGYVITRRGAQAMIDACSKVVRPIDDEMDRFWAHGIPNLALYPFPVIERLAVSSIGEDRYRGRRGRSRWRRMIEAVLRRWAMLRFRWTGFATEASRGLN